METYYLSAIESSLESGESALSNDASQITTLDDARFQLPPYDLTMDEFYQQWGNYSLERRMCSAFSAYIQPHSNAVADSFLSCESPHNKCFRFLRKIDGDRKLEIQISHPTAPSLVPNNDKEVNEKKKKNEPKSGFRHMIAERKRRVKLNEQFQNLCSLLPRNCKRDKLSILANTATHLRELKLRVCELERQNESANGQSFNSDRPILYRSDDVIFEQCKDILCQVKIIVNVQRNMGPCPPTLLMKVIALLSAEQLEILSLSHEKGFGFQSIFTVFPKGEEWDVSQWQTFGSLLTRTLN